MKTLLIFTLFLISVGGGESERVMGYSGGGVLIKCRYETQYTSNPKYLCEAPWPCMTKPIWTDAKNEWIHSGRFSLFDDTRAAQFWVVIRELTVKDSGKYKCAVDKDLAIDVYTPVELKVEEDQDYKKSVGVTGHVGGSVNISCKYSQSHSSDPKFLCRRVGTAGCTYKTSVKESRKWINEEKLSLHDNRARQIFTVSFNSLTEGDSGEYWCGAESDWTSDHGYKVYITQINLRVTASLPEKETILSPPSPPSRNPQSTKSNTSSSKPSGKSSSETIAPKGLPSSSVIVVVSVILLLLLIGLLFFIVILRKRSKTQDPASTQSQPLRDFSNNHKVPTADYDQIKDTRNCSDVGVSTVYTTADLPTNVSEPSQTVYDNVQLSTNPSEPSHAVYDNVQFISHCDFSNSVYSPAQSPPNSPDQVIYSTPELATLLLDSSNVTQPSAEKSAEGPTYAKVNFSQKANSSTDAVTTATINNSCNYAIVKY
uniref:Immunoglobulin domain-containing protein n=1 Tax=Pygocentrus nattereri TaxID=42514 RepID=A0AAR2KUC6_PYGNA